MRAVMVVALGVLLAGAACTADDAPGDNARPGRPAVRVTAAGVTVAPAVLSVGAVLRTPEGLTARRVRITLVFSDRRGRPVGRASDELAWCSGSCIWGGTFTGDEIGPRWREASRVRGTAAAAVADDVPPPRPARPLRVRRDRHGNVVGKAPADGTVVVVSHLGWRPVAGASRSVIVDEPFSIPAALVPERPLEIVRAELLPRPPPPGD